MLFLFNYILLYKLVFVFHGDVIKYIVNPIIWLIFAIIGYFTLYKDDKKHFLYQKDIVLTVIASALLYSAIFYTLGLFIGYTKNPYSSSLNGIIINLFSILLVMGLKEYIRNIFINEAKRYSFIYHGIIFTIFFISDINILNIIKSSTDVISMFNVLGKDVVPAISINIFMTYLCIKAGCFPAIVYRLLIFLPTIIVPIVPKYEWIIPTLFDVLFPLFTYLIIQYMLNKKDKYVPKEITKEFNPKSWIIIFTLTIVIIIFGLGGFGVKPSVIITASMQPKINPGDVVIIQPIDIKSIKAGDIIQYKIDGYSVVHRVINIIDDGATIRLILKGDNNKMPDRNSVTADQIVGKLKYHIPYLGYPSYLIKKMLKGQEVEVETGK